MESLEPVEEFVTEKYHEAPVGSDEREERVRDTLLEVIRSLRDLR